MEQTTTSFEMQQAKAQAVYQRLGQAFGLPAWDNPAPPLDELVNTILSQNTNDRNRDVAYNGLRARFSTWEAVRDAEPQSVIDAIRPAGLANQKGPRIQAVLQQITVERGALDLDFLYALPPEEAFTWLKRFKGVGPKTASIVLQFSLAMPAFPVDTHVYRVSGRIGLRPEKMSVEQTHAWLAKLFLPEQYGPGHLNLIRLGREICHARKPECPICPVNDLCSYYARLQSGESLDQASGDYAGKA
jgi:endonuclease-3